MPGAQIDDASAAEEAPDPPRHFPRLEQLFARHTTRVADRTRDAMEKRVAGKPGGVTVGQTFTGRRRETQFTIVAPVDTTTFNAELQASLVSSVRASAWQAQTRRKGLRILSLRVRRLLRCTS